MNEIEKFPVFGIKKTSYTDYTIILFTGDEYMNGDYYFIIDLDQFFSINTQKKIITKETKTWGMMSYRSKAKYYNSLQTAGGIKMAKDIIKELFE